MGQKYEGTLQWKLKRLFVEEDTSSDNCERKSKIFVNRLFVELKKLGHVTVTQKAIHHQLVMTVNGVELQNDPPSP